MVTLMFVYACASLQLTLLMSDSIGGNAKTQMIVNVSPAEYNFAETQNSLVYASRVKKVCNRFVRPIDAQYIIPLSHRHCACNMLSLLFVKERKKFGKCQSQATQSKTIAPTG
jgi:hypothetical protein